MQVEDPSPIRTYAAETFVDAHLLTDSSAPSAATRCGPSSQKLAASKMMNDQDAEFRSFAERTMTGAG